MPKLKGWKKTGKKFKNIDIYAQYSKSKPKTKTKIKIKSKR